MQKRKIGSYEGGGLTGNAFSFFAFFLRSPFAYSEQPAATKQTKTKLCELCVLCGYELCVLCGCELCVLCGYELCVLVA